MTFTPPGRPDLKLEHWTKVLKDAVSGRLKVDEEEYPFKKFNKKVRLSCVSNAIMGTWEEGRDAYGCCRAFLAHFQYGKGTAALPHSGCGGLPAHVATSKCSWAIIVLYKNACTIHVAGGNCTPGEIGWQLHSAGHAAAMHWWYLLFPDTIGGLLQLNTYIEEVEDVMFPLVVSQQGKRLSGSLSNGAACCF